MSTRNSHCWRAPAHRSLHTEGWGSGSRDGNAGCCASCCKRSFDDDEFEKEEQQLREQRLAREATEGEEQPRKSNEGVVCAQPTAEKPMVDRKSLDKRPEE